MKYRKIMPKVWHKLRQLNSDCKSIAFYCLTGPQTNRIGFYCLSEGLACEDLNLSPKNFLNGFETVCQTFGWQYDKSSRMFLIPTWFDYNYPENQSVVKSYINEFDDLPNNPLTNEFLKICQRYELPFPTPSPDHDFHGVGHGDVHGVPHPSQAKPEPSQAKPDICDEVFNLFNSICKDLPKVKEFTDSRKKSIRKRSEKLNTLEKWTDFFKTVDNSNFLNRRIEGKDFRASFNWLLKEDNFVKVLEGNYDNKAKVVLPIPDRKLPPAQEAKAKRESTPLNPDQKAELDKNLKKLGIKNIGKEMK